MTTFKIHPAIGIARFGNSKQFYLSPEQTSVLPTKSDENGSQQLDDQGQPIEVNNFKEFGDKSKIKRQAARFRVFAYADDPTIDNDPGQEIKIGQHYDFLVSNSAEAPYTVNAKVVGIQWTVHMANKKASWYAFEQTQGLHGYSATHPLRNPDVINADRRRQLIIDPGPQTVNTLRKRAEFSRGSNTAYPQTFPPTDTKPYTIDTLGELIFNDDDGYQRLIVLGGQGKAGSTKPPVITSFVNNDGWFDDAADGPVTAEVMFEYQTDYTDEKGNKKTTTKPGSMTVQVPSWIVTGYPRYAPQMPDMITMDECMYDVFVRELGYNPRLYGEPPFTAKSVTLTTQEQRSLWQSKAIFNSQYYPDFYRDIWPILERPNMYKYAYQFDDFVGGDPHNTGTNGNLSKAALSQPPLRNEDPHYQQRQFVYSILRLPEQCNQYKGPPSAKQPDYQPRLMPMLCGNNPLSNTAPDKFLTMTQTQLFMLKQWADGKFINTCIEWAQGNDDCQNPFPKYPSSGEGIDRGVLGNLLGGAFCPGGEMSWIITNPAIYASPYRIKHATYMAGQLSLPRSIDNSAPADLAAGAEPGDLTKYTGVPWHADFHECTTQDINITYDSWNNIELASTGDPAPQDFAYTIPWWPAHRPVVIYTNSGGSQAYWASGIPPNHAGDLQMVSAWNYLGFLGKNKQNQFIQQERDNQQLGLPIKPGSRVLGNPHQK